MKITFIGHAALLAESCGVRLLSDPWWRGPCFGAQWWIWPSPDLGPLAGRPVDYVYISHGHHDHLHPGTLARLEGRPTLLVAKSFGLADGLRSTLNLPVREVAEDEVVHIGNGLTAGIWPTYGDDSLMWLSDGRQVLINANDALHSAPRYVQKDFVARLLRRFSRIDYFFCGFATASHFPNCYRIPGMDHEATARQRQHYFNEQWIHLVRSLEPAFAFPFAGDVAFFEDDLFWLNAVLHNDTQMDDRIAMEFGTGSDARTVAKRIGPGFCVEDGKVLNPCPRPRFDDRLVRQERADDIRRATRYGSLSGDQMKEVVGLIRAKLERFPTYFGTCPFDYQYSIIFREGPGAIVVSKSGKNLDARTANEPIEGKLEVLTRFAYLRSSLLTPYGSEILFVGSGIRFLYPEAPAMANPVHRETISLLRPMTSDHGRKAESGLTILKERLRRIASSSGIRTPGKDLYDLEEWLVRHRKD